MNKIKTTVISQEPRKVNTRTTFLVRVKKKFEQAKIMLNIIIIIQTSRVSLQYLCLQVGGNLISQNEQFYIT